MGREMAARSRGRAPISKENGGVTAGQAKILKGGPATPPSQSQLRPQSTGTTVANSMLKSPWRKPLHLSPPIVSLPRGGWHQGFFGNPSLLSSRLWVWL